LTLKCDDMDLEREIQIIALEIQQGKIDFVKGTKKILLLIEVYKQKDVEI